MAAYIYPRTHSLVSGPRLVLGRYLASQSPITINPPPDHYIRGSIGYIAEGLFASENLSIPLNILNKRERIS